MSRPVIYFLFIIKFLFGLALIYWTIYMTLQSDVGKDDDNSFLSTYHQVDDDYNAMIQSNIDFEKKYKIKFILNDNEIDGLSINDVFLGQRVIKKRDIRKDMIKVGKNTFIYEIFTKDGKKVLNSKGKFLVTMAVTHNNDIHLDLIDEKLSTFNVKNKGFWNITGTIEVGDDKGYIFVKTNAR